MTYRKRAEIALGRRLKRHEHVHHHSETQLVICTVSYHMWLHKVMRQRGMGNRRSRPFSYILRDTDPALWRQVKSKAALQGISIKTVIEQILRRFVEQP